MKKRVLIVEDEPIIAQEIAFNLEDRGFEIVGIAHDSERALELLYKNKPDIAMLDIAIDGSLSGIDLAHIIREKYSIPFVFLTSFSDADTIAQASQTFAYGYLVKPFKDNDLAPAIQIALLKHESLGVKKMPSLNDIKSVTKKEITDAEYSVITLIWLGKKNGEMAEELFVSINTIKTHIRNVYNKFDIHSKPDLIKKLREI